MIEFSDERFHFLKIKEDEVLFEVALEHENERLYKASAIVNVSPIEWGHFLLVPQVRDRKKYSLVTKL